MDHLLSKEKVSDIQIEDLDRWLVDEGHLRILFNFEGLKKDTNMGGELSWESTCFASRGS